MVITFSKYNKKNNDFSIKGFGKNTTEIFMTIYAMATKLKIESNEYKSIEDVFKQCLELEKHIDRVEEI